MYRSGPRLCVLRLCVLRLCVLRLCVLCWDLCVLVTGGERSEARYDQRARRIAASRGRDGIEGHRRVRLLALPQCQHARGRGRHAENGYHPVKAAAIIEPSCPRIPGMVQNRGDSTMPPKESLSKGHEKVSRRWRQRKKTPGIRKRPVAHEAA